MQDSPISTTQRCIPSTVTSHRRPSASSCLRGSGYATGNMPKMASAVWMSFISSTTLALKRVLAWVVFEGAMGEGAEGFERSRELCFILEGSREVDFVCDLNPGMVLGSGRWYIERKRSFVVSL